MKKTFIMVFAAIALASCGGKTAPAAGDVVSDTVENVTETAATGTTDQATAAADSLTSALDQQLKSADAKSIAKSIADAQTTIEQLKKEGKTEEAEAYQSKIKEYVSANKDAITKVAKGDVTVGNLVNGIINLPSELKQSATDAKNAVSADANKAKTAGEAVGSALKEKAKSDIENAKKATEKKAAAKVEEGKQKVRDAANKKVNDVLNKALGN